MNFVFWSHPWVTVLFLLAAGSALPAARWKRHPAVWAGLFVLLTAAAVVAALAWAVPYREIGVLLLALLLLFFAALKEGRP